jgi:vacuolar-type H+-ATPase subunit E/Vma4
VKERIKGDPALYKKFIEKAVQSGVKSGTEEITVSRKDRSLFTDEFMQHLNSIASEVISGESSLRLADDETDIDGGVYLRSGRENFNASVTVSVESAVNELEPELAVILFEGEN